MAWLIATRPSLHDPAIVRKLRGRIGFEQVQWTSTEKVGTSPAAEAAIRLIEGSGRRCSPLADRERSRRRGI